MEKYGPDALVSWSLDVVLYFVLICGPEIIFGRYDQTSAGDQGWPQGPTVGFVVTYRIEQLSFVLPGVRTSVQGARFSFVISTTWI